MYSAWHSVTTTVRLEAVAPAPPPVPESMPTRITCRLTKTVLLATLNPVVTVAMTDM